MKRPAAVFGFTALITVPAVFFAGQAAAYIGAGICALLCMIFGLTHRRRGFVTALTVCAAVCASFLSYEAAYKLRYEPVKCVDGKTLTVTGTAADFPHTSGDYTVVRLSGCTAGGVKAVGISLYGKQLPDIRPGDTVTVKKAVITAADKNSVFFLHSLSQNNFHSVFSSGEISIRAGKRSGLVYRILTMRKTVSERLKISLSKEAAPIADALITGNRSDFTSEFSSGLRVSGSSHIFAVSGMHLSVWTAVLFSVFGSRFFSGRIVSALGIAFVLFFIVFTGQSPSVIRSGIMLLTAFSGNFLRKPSDAMNSLGLSAAIYILINPFAAGNVSFLLSLTATAAVIVTAEFTKHISFKNMFPLIRSVISFITGTLAASVTVTLFTLPVSCFFFGSASLLSGISSLLCTLPAETAMVSGALGAVLFGTGKLSGFPFYICEICAKAIIKIINALSSLDIFIIPLEAKPTAVFCVSALIVISAAAVLTSFNKRAVTACTAAVISAGLCIALTASSFMLPSTEIFISGNKNGDILISENHGESAVVIGMSGSFKSVSSVNREMTRTGRVNADLLILSPGVRNKPRFNSDYAPRDTINSNGTSSLTTENAVLTQTRFRLSDNTCLTYTRRDGFCGCICVSGKYKTAFVFSGKKYPLPEEYLSADIIVFKNGMPENAASSPARKIMLSVSTDENTTYAADTGGIKIVVK